MHAIVCQNNKVQKVRLINAERFSSGPRDFQVLAFLTSALGVAPLALRRSAVALRLSSSLNCHDAPLR